MLSDGLKDKPNSAVLSQSSFEGSQSGNLLSGSEDSANRLLTQNSASSLRGADTENVMEKLRMRFQAYGLGGAAKQQSSKEFSFSERLSTLRDRNSMHKDQKPRRSSLSSNEMSATLVSKSSIRGKSIVLSDEKKMATQLRTYLKLSQSMGPMFVLSDKKKRENIFHAIKVYHKNENITRLSVSCLELLAGKTDDKAVFEEIMKNFGNLAALVGTHVTNVDFSRDFLSLAVHIIKKDKSAMPQFDDPAYLETFRQINNEHPSDPDIQNYYMILSDKLGIQKQGIDSSFNTPRGSIYEKAETNSALDKLRRRIQAVIPNAKIGLNSQDSLSTAYESSILPSNSPRRKSIENLERKSVTLIRTETDDNRALDEWAAEDLLDTYECEGDLVSWDDDGDDNNVKPGKSKETPRKSKARTYTARRLKELQMQNAQRDETVIAHKNALSRVKEDYEKVQNEYQADKTLYASFFTSMQETEKKFKEEIAKLKSENDLIKTTEAELSEQALKLRSEMNTVQGEKNEKKKQFENMKAMVTQQMNEAKGHYVGVRQRLEDAKVQLSKIQEALLETENKLTATQKEQEKKLEEYNELQTSYQMKQREYEESRMKAANLENRFNTIRSDFSTKIATNHQELAKGQSDIRLAHQMHGTFKAQLMKLKMENTAMKKSIHALQSSNTEGNRIDNHLKQLNKENTDLKARLKDLIKKDAGGEKLSRVKAINKKLKKEKSELMQMTEMLLARTEK